MIDSLDWKAITSSVAAECEDPSMISSVTEAIDRALRRWLPTDLREFHTLGGIEQKIETERNGRVYKGIIDLWGRDENRMVLIKDWKTGKTIDQKWQDRLERSDQGSWYGLLFCTLNEPVGCVSVEYRGVKNDDAKVLRSARQNLTIGSIAALDEDLSKWEQWYGILDKDWQRPWPKDRSGCRCYGPRHPCAFLDICDGLRKYNYTGPNPQKGMSFSMLGELKRCPERLRLLTLSALNDPTPTERSEASTFGTAFHAGIATAYEEAFERRDKNGSHTD